MDIELIPETVLEHLPTAVAILGADLSLHWMNAHARGFCHERLLAELLDQTGVREKLSAPDGIQVDVEDSQGRIRLQRLNVLIDGRIFCHLEDLTSRDRLDEEYRRLQKAGSLYRFSQGLGHDLKNCLTGVVGNLSLARLIIDEGRPCHEAGDVVRDAERAALEADSLVQQFMRFSHNDSHSVQNLDILSLLNSAAAMALGTGNKRFNIASRETVWKVDGNPGQIQQAFQNIVQNAGDAMPGGGIIHVEIENLRIQQDEALGNLEPGHIRDGQYAPGDYVVIHIRDEGEGILTRDLTHVFEPFFSRKGDRQGLGLTVALSVVRKHNGFIEIHSTAGKGTTVSLFLPVSGTGEQLGKTIKAARLIKILVMDDDEMVREVWERMLTRLGHRCSFAAEGVEAVYLYQTALHSDHPFDLVILDLTIPGGMGALETLEQLKVLDPNVRSVICSGYAQDPLMQRFAECGFKGALAKPFGLSTLQRLIQDIE